MAEKYSVVEVVELNMEEAIKFASSFSAIEFSTSEKVTDRRAGLTKITGTHYLQKAFNYLFRNWGRYLLKWPIVDFINILQAAFVSIYLGQKKNYKAKL